jgi:hypothetical protein
VIDVAKIKEMQTVHYDSTTPMDEYHGGFYNGIEYVLCMIEQREPNYKDVEKPSARKRHLESLIMGHQEAMRPLLDEWSKL